MSNTPVDRETGEGNTRTYVFRETKPLPSYLIAFAVGPWEFVDAGTAGKNHVPVRIVVPKGRREEAQYAAKVTAPILTRLENYFGIPYPYKLLEDGLEEVLAGRIPLRDGFRLLVPGPSPETRKVPFEFLKVHV